MLQLASLRQSRQFLASRASSSKHLLTDALKPSSTSTSQRSYSASIDSVPPPFKTTYTPSPTNDTFPAPAVPHRYQRYRLEGDPKVRELPKLKSKTPMFVLTALGVASVWGAFLFFATNTERSNSSIFKALTFQLRHSSEVREFLGEGAQVPVLFGEFKRVKGVISVVGGRIDIQFRVVGSEAGGTASFTSIRRGKAARFEVIRWHITRDDGKVLDLVVKDPKIHAILTNEVGLSPSRQV